MNTAKEGFKEKSIIMAGNAASSAALFILDNYEEKLKDRYSDSYLESARKRFEAEKKYNVNENIPGISESVACSSGGVFEALWKLGEELGTGLTVELAKIPIFECTIELCDHMDINPYEAESDGCILVVTDEPGKVLEYFEKEDGKASVIGYTTDVKARIIKGSTVRYLTKT